MNRIDLRALGEYLIALNDAEREAHIRGEGWVRVTYTKGNWKRIRFKGMSAEGARAALDGKETP